LAFGSSFDAVKNAKGHPWVNTLKQSLHASLFPDVFRRVPLLKIWPTLVMPVGISSERKEHFRLSGEKVKQRQLMPNDRDDFFSHLLSEKATNISHEFLTAQANTLIVAGSETTATFLIGKFY
jgi:cytochrome P450